ncbi:Tyrosine recombinase XerC [Vibrio thalassae]|uniref:Tyrosine recombinase XerC n=1 Tax=Vibrio thalassae TaxID=1243014 RepID=A0A240EMK7_9VIBR|nr:Tyrosine recombinase XerC [Vibrio thalassae]
MNLDNDHCHYSYKVRSCLHFNNTRFPLRRYKSLKEEKADSSPLTADEVKLFLSHTSEEWRDYFLIRFWTGIRSCELHGLYWEHIDFKHRRIKQRRTSDCPFVFSDKNGGGLSTQFVSRKIWQPTLKKAGLKHRRAYETRHTAAVLHIAALENPLYISHMLGHSDIKLLFEIYAPYIANAARQDGQNFSTMMQGGIA